MAKAIAGPRRRKIEDRVLVSLVAQGKSYREIGEALGCTDVAVGKRARQLGLDTLRKPAAMAHLDEASWGVLDVATRLRQIDAALVSELEFLRRQANTSDERRVALLDKTLTTLGELRKVLGTALELERMRISLAGVAEFRGQVLEILAEFPDVKAALLAKLRERVALRHALTPAMNGDG